MGLKRSSPSLTRICKYLVWALDPFLRLMKPRDPFSKVFFFLIHNGTKKGSYIKAQLSAYGEK